MLHDQNQGQSAQLSAPVGHISLFQLHRRSRIVFSFCCNIQAYVETDRDHSDIHECDETYMDSSRTRKRMYATTHAQLYRSQMEQYGQCQVISD